jgi:hypothetical protein
MIYIKQRSLDDLNGLDLLPLACLQYGIARISKASGLRFEREADDLDDYEMSALELDDATNGHAPLLFALRAYRGAPPDTVDVLLPAELLGAPGLNRLVADIARALGVPAGRITWPEASGPAKARDRDERRRVL